MMGVDQVWCLLSACGGLLACGRGESVLVLACFGKVGPAWRRKWSGWHWSSAGGGGCTLARYGRVAPALSLKLKVHGGSWCGTRSQHREVAKWEVGRSGLWARVFARPGGVAKGEEGRSGLLETEFHCFGEKGEVGHTEISLACLEAAGRTCLFHDWTEAMVGRTELLLACLVVVGHSRLPHGG